MGIIRGGAVFFIGVLLLLLLLVGGILLTVKLSLDYDVIKPELTSMIKTNYLGEANLTSEIEPLMNQMRITCINNPEFIYSNKDFGDLSIPCEVVANGSEAVIDYSLNNFVDNIYYKEYNCDIFDCIKQEEQPFVLVSEKSKDYFSDKFYTLIFISLVLILGLFFLIEKKSNLISLVGGLVILSSLPLVIIEKIFSFFVDYSLLDILQVFFTQSHRVFLTYLIFGLILLMVGIGVKLFRENSDVKSDKNKSK